MAENQQSAAGRQRFSPLPSLAALALGLATGIAAYQTQWPALLTLQELLQPIGQLWLRALRMTVFPLVIVNLIVAILNTADTRSFGRLSVATLLMFLLFLVAGGLFTMTAGGAVISLLPVDPNASEALASLSGRAAQIAGQAVEQPSFGAWVMELIPTNPFTAMADGQLLPVLVFTALFALALTKVSTENRVVAQRFFNALCETMLVLIGWILYVTPLGIFALASVIATGLGTGAVTALLQWLLLIVAFLVAGLVLLYPITSLLGGMSMSRFAQGVLPAQIVAAGTRSSLACLPALLDGARDRLGLTPGVANLTLPLSVSVFKINRTISSTLKLLAIAHMFGIDISTGQTITFIATVIILSFSAVGIPLGGGGMKTLPAYLAAGIPLEAYVLFRAVESIPDIFKTVLNVTGDMSVAVIANRWFAGSFRAQCARALDEPQSAAATSPDANIRVQDER